jgi:hypothetical protein
MKHTSEIHGWLSDVLKFFYPENIQNRFSEIDAKILIAESVIEIRNDFIDGGMDLSLPHWELIMNDFDDTEPGFYVFLGFEMDYMRLVVGVVNKWDVIKITDTNDLGMVEQVFIRIKETSIDYKDIVVSRSLGEAWFEQIQV